MTTCLASADRSGSWTYAVGHGPRMAPGEPAAERDSFGEVVLVGRLRDTLLLKLLSGS